MKHRYKSFETERLILKPTSENDSKFLFDLLNAPNWIKYIGDRNIKSIHDAKVYINIKITPQFKRHGYSVYTLIKKNDKVKIGTCGLYDRDGVEGFDLGFAMLPKYENMGYGFESAKKLINICFKEFSLDILNAITTKDNISSIKLIEKLGFKFSRIAKLPYDEKEFQLYKIKNPISR
jgi:RimJ/RimL family protein N-acetyltransferase